MTSYPLGKIRCTSCGSFINRKYGAYRRLLEMNYSSLKAFEALHIPRYCCRMHIENPDIITLSLTTREVKNIERSFKREYSEEKEAQKAVIQLAEDFFDIDANNAEDPTSLVRDDHTERMVSSVLQGTFANKIKKMPIIKISNEQIDRVKRENRSAQVHKGEPILYDKEGNILKKRPLPIIIKPVRPETRKQEMEAVRISKEKKIPRPTVQTTAKSSLFSTGYRPRRAAVRPAKEGEKGAYESERKEGTEIVREKMKVMELERGEKVPKGYREAYVTSNMFDVGYKKEKRSAIRPAREGEEGEDVYEVKGDKAIGVEEGKPIFPKYRVVAKKLEEGEEVPEGYKEAYVVKPLPVEEVSKEYKLVNKLK